ncbi:hypothetical protein ACIO7M_24685 [Streptomyces toxytricini]|uniref:Integral membrane protein n=1 Tax=Streptomyces toxytricini TaxID=67369 RepID=A0ABW8EQD6_STRT5
MSTAGTQAHSEATGPLATVDEIFRTVMGSHAPDGDERPEDRLISRMQTARTLLGLGGAVWLVLAYPLSTGREEFVLGKLVELGMACAVLLTGSVLGITAFLAAGAPDRRRAFARRLAGPLVCVLALALGPAVFWLALATVKGDLVGEVELVEFYSSLLGRGILCSVLSFLTLVIGCLLAVAVLIVSVPYTIVTAYACVTSCFRASDVHQLLPALLSPLLVWSLFAFQLFNGPDVAAPPEVLYTFLLGGPLSVTALSVWEVRRLRTRYGITLRNALGR